MRRPNSGTPFRVSVIVLAVGAMVLVGSPAQALGWTTIASPSEVPGNNLLYGADSSDARNVWAVGVVYPPLGGSSHGLALRYDGTAWRSVPGTGLPGNDTLRGVDAVSAGDVWARSANTAPESAATKPWRSTGTGRGGRGNRPRTAIPAA